MLDLRIEWVPVNIVNTVTQQARCKAGYLYQSATSGLLGLQHRNSPDVGIPSPSGRANVRTSFVLMYNFEVWIRLLDTSASYSYYRRTENNMRLD
jgi:hypothetical protein